MRDLPIISSTTGEEVNETSPLLSSIPSSNVSTQTKPFHKPLYKDIISHRGFTTLPLSPTSSQPQHPYPENSLPAFQTALSLSLVTAVETDLHLSSSSTLWLSHDPTLSRIFGLPYRIRECSDEFLRSVRTKQDPNVGLATLEELLEVLWSDKGGREGLGRWVLLDLKPDEGNPPSMVVRRIREACERVAGGEVEKWGGRVKLGVWARGWLRIVEEEGGGLPVVNIGFSLPYSWKFLSDPQVIGFNVQWSTIMYYSRSGSGKRFLDDCRDSGKEVYVWTVNDSEVMKWAIEEEGVKGVCTDDPERVGRLVEGWEKGEWRGEGMDWGWWWRVLKAWVVWWVIGWAARVVLRERFRDELPEDGEGEGIVGKKVEEEVEGVLGEVGGAV